MRLPSRSTTTDDDVSLAASLASEDPTQQARELECEEQASPYRSPRRGPYDRPPLRQRRSPSPATAASVIEPTVGGHEPRDNTSGSETELMEDEAAP